MYKNINNNSNKFTNGEMNMKKYLSLFLALLMCFSTVSFAIPSISTEIESFDEPEEIPVEEQATESIAEVQAVDLPTDSQLGTLIFEANFEEYGTRGSTLTPIDAKSHPLATGDPHANKDYDFGIVDGNYVTDYTTSYIYGSPGTKTLVSDGTNNYIKWGAGGDQLFGVTFSEPLTEYGIYTLVYDLYDTGVDENPAATYLTKKLVCLSKDDTKDGSIVASGGSKIIETSITETNAKTGNWKTYMYQYKLDSSVTTHSQIQQFVAYIGTSAADKVYLDNFKVYFQSFSNERELLEYKFDDKTHTTDQADTTKNFVFNYASGLHSFMSPELTSLQFTSSGALTGIEFVEKTEGSTDKYAKITRGTENQINIPFGTPVTQKGIYTFSMDLYVPSSNAGNTATTIKLRFRHSNGSLLQAEPSITAKDQWITVKGTYALTNDGTAMTGLQFGDSSALPLMYIDNIKLTYAPLSATLSDISGENTQKVSLTGDYTFPTTYQGNTVSTWVEKGGSTSYSAGQTITDLSLISDKTFIAINKADTDAYGELLTYFDFTGTKGTTGIISKFVYSKNSSIVFRHVASYIGVESVDNPTGANDEVVKVTVNSGENVSGLHNLNMTDKGIYTVKFNIYADTSKINPHFKPNDSTNPVGSKQQFLSQSNTWCSMSFEVPIDGTGNNVSLSKLIVGDGKKTAGESYYIDDISVWYKPFEMKLTGTDDYESVVKLESGVTTYTLPAVYNRKDVAFWLDMSNNNTKHENGAILNCLNYYNHTFKAIYADEASSATKGELLYYFDFEKIVENVFGYPHRYDPSYYANLDWVSAPSTAVGIHNMGSTATMSVVEFDGDGAFKSVKTTYNQPGMAWTPFTKLGTYTAEYELYIPTDATIKQGITDKDHTQLQITGFTSSTSTHIGSVSNIPLTDIARGEWNTITSVGVVNTDMESYKKDTDEWYNRNYQIGGFMFIDSGTNVSEFYVDNFKVWFKPATVKFGATDAQDLNGFTESYTVPDATAGSVWVSSDGKTVLVPGQVIEYADYTALLQDKVFTEQAVSSWLSASDNQPQLRYSASDADRNGIRFFANVSADGREMAVEYGFEVSLTGDFATKISSKLYDKATIDDDDAENDLDKYYETTDDGTYVLSIVFYGIPVEGYDSPLYVRPYIKVDGHDDLVYGTTFTPTSLYDVAKLSEGQNDYADSIIDAVKNSAQA